MGINTFLLFIIIEFPRVFVHTLTHVVAHINFRCFIPNITHESINVIFRKLDVIRICNI